MSKDRGIKLSKKHGVNPSMCQCFFCGEVKAIALMGQLIGEKGEDLEAPRMCVMDYEPCDKCIENMKLGVTLIEVTTTQPTDNRPPMTAQGGTQVYPTGRYLVLKEEAVNRIFNMSLEKGQKIFIDPETYKLLMNGKEEN